MRTSDSRPAAAPFAALLATVLLAGCSSGGNITPIRTPFDRGVYHHSRGELEPAIAQYRSALDDDATDVRARFNLAVAYEDLAADERRRGHDGDRYLRAAETEYRRILASSPQHLRTLLNLAALEADTGRTGAARRRLAAAGEQHAGEAQWHVARAAMCLRDGGGGDPAPGATADPDPDSAAAAAIEAALDLDPQCIDAWLLQGDLRQRRHDAAGALAAYRRALALAPDDLAALRAVGAAAAAQGLHDEAVAAYGRLLLLAADDVGAHLALADVHEAAGDYEAAVAHLWRARDLDDSVPPTADYAARLRGLYARLLAALSAAK